MAFAFLFEVKIFELLYLRCRFRTFRINSAVNPNSEFSVVYSHWV